MPFIVTRINVGDYDRWKPMFDKDEPGARQYAKGYRILRGVENPHEVFIVVEFASIDEARAGRRSCSPQPYSTASRTRICRSWSRRWKAVSY